LINKIDSIKNDTIALNQKLVEFEKTNNRLGQLIVCEKLGSAYRVNAMFPKAIKYHRKGLELATEIQDSILIIQSLNNLGTDFRRIGALAEASDYHFKALRLSDNFSGRNDSISIKNKVIALNGIGNISLSLMRLDEATQYFHEALKIEKQLKSELGQAINNANLGSVFVHKMQYDSALYYFQKSMELNKSIDSKLGIALCYSHIGDIYLELNKYDDALKQYQNAYDIMQSSPDKWHWLDICLSIGNLYILKNDNNKAQYYLDLAKKTAVEIDSRDHLLLAYKYLSQLHQIQGKYKEALNEQLICRAYSDSIRSDRQINLLIDMRLKNEHEKTIEQIRELHVITEYHKDQNKSSKLIIISLAILLISTVIVFYYRIRFNRKKEKEMNRLEKMKSNFFMNITHEFRTPITVILGLSNHIYSSNSEYDQLLKHNINAIIRQGKNLLHLVNQMLDIAKSEAGASNPTWKNGNVVDYLRVITDSYTHFTETKKIHLVFYSDESTINTNYVPTYLKKIMGNLISNSIKHCNENDKIVIHIGQNVKEYFIHVMDTGEGIINDDITHIFELYYQAKGDKTTSLGSGIGLALTKQLIEELNGKISAKSIPNKETIFKITFPITNNEILNSEIVDEEIDDITDVIELNKISDNYNAAENNPTRSTKNQISVLIIEDNNDVAYYISTILSSKYEVRFATNGNEGLAMAENILPDIIITDVMMPEKDGISLIKEIRKSLAICHIPIIVITAKNSSEDRIIGLEAGADAYLAKPFEENELVVIIKQILENRAKLKEKYSLVMWQDESLKTDDVNIRFLQQVTKIVYRELNNPEFLPNGLANEMCLSVSQLKRKLRDLSGVNYSSFIMQARLNKAKKLLKNSDKTVSEIAYECGFNDLGYFSRSFKNMFGFAPSQYQRLPQ
jgi:signal transduction histidine kinase/DNA-binding response OmpR family regulator